jgi:toxin YoeB
MNCERSSALKSEKQSKKRDAVISAEFRDDLRYWAANNRKMLVRVLDLMEAIMRDPFAGIGKPEPLKYIGAGTWSRRVTQEHRIVYKISNDRINFLQARFHY